MLIKIETFSNSRILIPQTPFTLRKFLVLMFLKKFCFQIKKGASKNVDCFNRGLKGNKNMVCTIFGCSNGSDNRIYFIFQQFAALGTILVLSSAARIGECWS